jgi:hypothetical protein
MTFKIKEGLSVNGSQLSDGERNLSAKSLTANAGTSSTNTTTGTVIVTGGVGISENLNIGGDLDVGGAFTISGTTDITGDLTIGGNLVVNGTTTTVNSTTVTVDDKNIELGSVATPSDTTANGGGITLKGATDKTILWLDATDRWTFNQAVEATSIQNTPIGSNTASTGAFTTLAASGITTLSGLLNANSGIAVDTDKFTVADATGNTVIAGTLNVTGTTTLAGLSASTGSFSGQVTSTVATGSAPFVVASTTKVTNLNADLLDGLNTDTNNTASTIPVRDSSKNLNFSNAVMSGSSSGTTTLQPTAAASGTLTLPAATDTLVGKATTDTLTNKTLNLTNNTLSGTLAQFNTALSDADFASIAGTETLTNKTLTNPTVNAGSGVIVLPGAVSPAQTAEGSIVWDTDNDLLTVGTGSARKTLVDTDSTQTLTNKTFTSPTITGVSPTITLTGDVTGTGTLTDLGSVSFATTIAANSVALGTDTTGNYVATIAGTTDQITVTGSGSETAAITLALPQSIATTSSPTFAGATLDAIQVGITNANTIDTSSGNLTINSVGGTVTVDDNLVVSGNLTVNGTTTTVNSTTVTVDDKNIELGTVDTPTDVTADTGGITLRGATDKTFNWLSSTASWTSSENLDLVSGKIYKINGTNVLTSTALGTAVVGSSLTSVGTLTTGTWNASVINSTYGGTGVNNGGRTITLSTGNLTLTAQAGGSSVTVPSTGTLATTSNKLSAFAATTSSELAGVISDETGSGALVFATSPTLVTPALGTPSSATLTNATGLPVSTGISGLGAGVATFLATPSSANLATAVTDETGSGALVFANTPTLVTPVLGVATATSINKLSITAPATGATLAIADGKTLTTSNTLTFTGTDSSSVNFAAGGTVVYTSNKLSVHAATTSAELAGVISDETGTGALVFANTPTLVTPNIGAATGTSLSVSGQLTSTVATGTAPLAVTSTTRVANLNAATAGTADTAATWTTARTLTVGNTGKSVNGSANVAWTLSEIGAAEASHKYHAFSSGQYFFDGYEQGNYFRLFTQNAAYTTARYRPFSNVEYWNFAGSAWTTWAAGEAGIRNLLDGREETTMSVSHENRRFRFTINVASGYPTLLLYYLQSTWSAITYTSMTVTLETSTTQGGTYTLRDTAVFGAGTTGNTYGIHARTTSATHTGDSYVRVTIDITDWVDSTTYTTIPLRNFDMLSNYSGGALLPLSWNYYQDVTVGRNLSASALASTIATGTAPLTVNSTTRVANLNVATAGTADILTTARTINGVSFNGSADITISAASANALTIGTGLSGTSYNGSSAVTIAIDSTVATLTGTQTLTNKTFTDSTTFFQDETDNSKRLQFQLSGIGAATTQTLTVQNLSGTIALTGNNLGVFSATTSAQLAGVISDETGSGVLVFGTSPTITTSVVAGSATMAVFNTTATTVNAFGAATTLNLGAATGTTTVSNNLTVTGNLTINGTTTTVNSTTTTLDDPIFTLGGDTAPTSDDNKDRGIEFRYFDTSAKVGFFGYDDSTGKFTFLTAATNASEVFSGTKGEVDASVDWSNVLNKPDPVITLAGDLTGSVTLTDLASGTLTATIAANSVALGTDTTGNYVATIADGTPGTQTGTSGLVITAAAGEGTAATIAHADTSSVANLSSDNSGSTFIQDISFTFDGFGHVTAASVATGNALTSQANDFGNVAIGADSGYTWGSANTNTTQAADSVSDTLTLVNGGGINLFTNTVAGTDAIKIEHADTSSVANLSSDNSGNTFIQDISFTFDTYGHVTAATVATATALTTESDTLATVTGRGATTATAVTFTNNAASTTTTSGAVQVTGGVGVGGQVTAASFGINGSAVIEYVTATTSATSQVSIATFAAATYRSAKYYVQMTSASNYHVAEIMVIHNGTTASMVQYGDIYTTASAGTFDADISGGNVRLLFTPAIAATTVKMSRLTMVV